MSQRIFGIETEYGITAASNSGGTPPIEPEAAAEVLFEPIVAMSRSSNTFLGNGSRLYLDVGSHPEYATAECNELTDLIANDRAGDLIFSQLAVQAATKLQSTGIDATIHLFKNNLDSAGNSFGCHENYLVRRRRDFRERIDWLIPFFVTRQIMVGAGNIRQDSGVFSYEFSQRADQMWDAVSSASTRSRPMVNTRDEPHGDAELYRRMHVIVGDSTMLEPTTALKVGATEALLNVVEDGVRLPQLALKDPTRAIRDVSRDISGKAIVELESGISTTALDLQQTIHDLVRAHYDARGWTAELDPLRLRVFDLWTRVLDALRAGDISSLAKDIDWVAKKQLLDIYTDRLSVGFDDPRIARLMLAWHDITSDGLREKLEARGVINRIVTDDEVVNAAQIPPQTTRAKLRGEFIAAASASRRDFTADWMNLRLLDETGVGVSVTLKDPFATTNSEVDALMAELGT